jgi:parallel beta-helix repeat protein
MKLALRIPWTMLALVCIAGCDDNGPAGPAVPLYLVGPTGNFRSIGAAINAAPEGEIIEVQAGSYAERVVINKRGIKLRGTSAVLDGALLDGLGIGIHIAGTADVEVSGFTVRNFERGVVVENATNASVQRSEVHSTTSKAGDTAPPLSPGVSLFEGVVLIGAVNTQVIDNVLRNNGHDGVMLLGGSRNNTIRNNRIRDNGVQTTPGLFG